MVVVLGAGGVCPGGGPMSPADELGQKMRIKQRFLNNCYGRPREILGPKDLKSRSKYAPHCVLGFVFDLQKQLVPKKSTLKVQLVSGIKKTGVWYSATLS